MFFFLFFIKKNTNQYLLKSTMSLEASTSCNATLPSLKPCWDVTIDAVAFNAATRRFTRSSESLSIKSVLFKTVVDKSNKHRILMISVRLLFFGKTLHFTLTYSIRMTQLFQCFVHNFQFINHSSLKNIDKPTHMSETNVCK